MKIDPAEMALILEQVRQEAKKNRLAHTEKKELNFPGTIENMFPINSGLYVAKISEEEIDLKAITAVTVTGPTGQLHFEVTDENSNIERNEMFGEIMTAEYGGQLVGVCFVNTDEVLFDGIGTYVFGYKGDFNGVVSHIKLETIHPIPQEYIPPLDRLILNGADGNQYALTITDGAVSVAPVTT